MKLLEPLSEDEMVALFLKGEIASSRFGQTILALLDRDGMEHRIVRHPDIGNEAHNAYRRELLGEFRGYGRNVSLFEGFPNDVRWYRALVSKPELSEVVYIKYDYWIELSGGSRLPRDAARRIREGVEIFGVSNQGFWKLAEGIRAGASLPQVILVGTSDHSPFVILEGHARLTSYFLVPELIPQQLRVVVGLSEHMGEWADYPA
jgi:hypothetical protein